MPATKYRDVVSGRPRSYRSAAAAKAIAATPNGIAAPAIRLVPPAASRKGSRAPVTARPQAIQKDQSTRGFRTATGSIERNHARIDRARRRQVQAVGDVRSPELSRAVESLRAARRRSAAGWVQG